MYTQKSKRKSGSVSNKNESLMFDDIQYIFSQIGISESSFYANGFKVTGPINANIILPENSNITYQGPLTMGAGYTLTVSPGTILTII